MKTHKILPYLLSFLLICIMLSCSQWLDEPDIIFPVAAALLIGAWLSPQQVWRTSSIKFLFLILIYSTLGVVMVKYVEIPLFLKIISAFFMCSMGLLMSHTTFFSLISTCILPIFMEIESWIYPISATVIAFLIISIQKYLRSHHYLEPSHYVPVQYHTKQEIFMFIKRMIVIIVMTYFALQYDSRLLIAPPLIVAFFDLSSSRKKLKQQLLKKYLITVIMAFVGAYLRYYMMIENQLPLLLTGACVTLILLIMIYITKIYFPPIGAIALLPFLIDIEMLLIYPAYIAGGFALFIIFAFIFTFQRKGKHLNQEHFINE